MAKHKVKFIPKYSEWFSLPLENLMNMVIGSGMTCGDRKFICATRLKGIVTYEEIETLDKRMEWAENHPEWKNLANYIRQRKTVLKEKAIITPMDDWEDEVEIESDSFDWDID